MIVKYMTYWKQSFQEFIRYFIAGGIAFVADFCVLMFLYKVFNVHYLIASAIGLLIGFVTVYLLSIKWVFKKRAVKNKKIEVVIFLLIGGVGFILNELIMWVSVEYLALVVSLSKIIATGVVFIWNFTARKYILFRSVES